MTNAAERATGAAERGRFRGFTLIELVVVMLIVAMLSSITVFSLSATIGRRQLSLAIESLERFDARLRREARARRVPLTAQIRPQHGTLSIGGSRRRERVEWKLPRQVKIADIRMRRRVVAGGDFTLRVNRFGHSETYAVELARRGVRRWIIVLGASGQVVTAESQEQADALLAI